MTLSFVFPARFRAAALRCLVAFSLIPFNTGLQAASASSSQSVQVADSFKFGDFVGFIQRGASEMKPLEPLLVNLRQGLTFKEQSADLLFLVNCQQGQGSVTPVSLYSDKAGVGEHFVPKSAALGFGAIQSKGMKSCSDKAVNQKLPVVQGAEQGNWKPFFLLNGHLFLVNLSNHSFKSKDYVLEFEAQALNLVLPTPTDTSLISNEFKFTAQCGPNNQKVSRLKIDNSEPQDVKPGTTFHQLLVAPLCDKAIARQMGYEYQLGLQ